MRPVRLPLIVEGITFVVPVYGLIVNPLLPVHDGGLNVLRHVVEGDDKIGEFQQDGAVFDFVLD